MNKLPEDVEKKPTATPAITSTTGINLYGCRVQSYKTTSFCIGRRVCRIVAPAWVGLKGAKPP